jgi:hypothetical protein
MSEVRHLLSADLEELTKQKSNLSAYADKAKQTSCIFWLVILLVVLLFTFTFVLIRMFPNRKYQ